MTANARPPLIVPEFAPALPGFRADEFLALTETLLDIPIEQGQERLDTAPFRLDRPEPRPETPLPPLPSRWYPRPVLAVIEAARAWLKSPPRPRIFEGRANEIARVLRPLLSGSPVQVRGEAGAGKTTLLATIAAHERTRQRFRRIWWFDDPDRLDQTLALALNLPHVLTEPDPTRRWGLLAAHLDEHTLLIVDNLADGDPRFDALLALSEHVLVAAEIVPEVPDPDAPAPDEPLPDPEGVVTLRALDDLSAIDALARHAGLEDARRLRPQLLHLARALGNHPYALMLAGTLLRRDGLSLDDLERLLSADGAGLAGDAETGEPDEQASSEDEEATPDAPESVAVAPAEAQSDDTPAVCLSRALDASVAALPRDYRRLFEAFAAFPPVGAPLDGLRAVAGIGSALSARRGMTMLIEYGFIARDHRDPDLYVMHPVPYARAAADDDEHPAQSKIGKKMRAWALRYARAHSGAPLALYRAQGGLLHAYHLANAHGPVYIGEPLAEALRPYLREYVPGLPPGDEEPPELSGARAEAANLLRYGIELTDQGAYYAAEEALNRALALRQEHDSAHAIAETLVAQARLLDMAGHAEDAAEKLLEAAEMVFQLGAEGSLSVIRRGLARVYRHLGRLGDALDVLDEAPEAHAERAAILRARGEYAAAVAEIAQAAESVPYDRAEIFLLAGQYSQAMDALTGQEDHDSAHLRAQIHHLRGDVAAAIAGYRAALEEAGEIAPRARAKTLRGLGAALASAGEYDAARDALGDALALYRAEMEPNALQIGRTLRLLAAVHLAAGDMDAAIATAREALIQLQRADAPADSADAYRTLGRALWREGDHAAALAAFQGEVENAQGAPERDERRIGRALHRLADSCHAVGQAERAIANYRLALTHKRPSEQPDDTLISQLALHRVLVETERLPAALEISQEMLDHLTRQQRPDLGQLGYVQALRARTQQAMERPIRARQSLSEWARALASRAAEAFADERPALRALALGLAVRSLLAEGRPALALELAERAQTDTAAHLPGTLAAWAATRDLGEAYRALDRPEEAILVLEPLLGETVRDAPGGAATFACAHALSGRAYWQIGEADSALEHLRAALEHEPNNHERALLCETIAAIQLELNRPGEAVESLRMALPLLDREERAADSARLLTTLAHTLGGLNRYAEAITVYEDALNALRAVPDASPAHTADVLRSLGQTHEAQGQLPKAAQAYRRALNVLERADVPRQSRDILHLLARVTAALGDQSAVTLYEQVRDATREMGTGQELGQVLCELAGVHRDARRFPLAIQYYQAALAQQPAPPFAQDRINSLRNLGRALAMMGRYDEARIAWTEALELTASLPDQSPVEIGLTHHAIAEAHRSQHQYTEAMESFREALHHLPPRSAHAAAALRALGQTLLAAERPADAIEPLRDALEVERAQPQQANARIVQTLQLLADAHEHSDDLRGAIARYHEALVYMDRDLQPVAYADALRILGGLYGAQGETAEAIKAYSEALEIEGDYVPRSDKRISDTLGAIASTYRAAGDLEKAAEFYQKVTMISNMARRASDDLRETLDELERRRGTLQAAQQSLALLKRREDPPLKDLAFIYALIAHAHDQLNQPQDSETTIHTLFEELEHRAAELSTDDPDDDARALAWLLTATRTDDPSTAQFACGSALEAVRNRNLRWVIEQIAQSLEEPPDS
ncbi:MAG: tetratricopeptide repeat protein [Anaerolineae bacterium]|nr:tetratricopeptide repeat protein [Anaerolineae bacterium]